MATLQFDLVFSDLVTISCGQGGITCVGDGRMVTASEDFTSGAPPYSMRIFHSDDNGLTWTEGPTYSSIASIWFHPLYSPASGRVLAATEGPYQCTGAIASDMLPVSLDGGLTWSGTTGSLFSDDCNDFWTTFGFVPLDNDEIWAVGEYNIGGVETHILKSTDGGLSFGNPVAVTPLSGATAAYARCGCYLGSDIVLLGGRDIGAPVSIWRSTDRGATYTSVALPNTQYAYAGFLGDLKFIISLGSGVVLAGGTQTPASNRGVPKLWRSTDSGASWTEISLSLTGWNGIPETTSPFSILMKDAVSPAPGVAVVMQHGLGGTTSDVWRYSVDGGVTWLTPTVSAPTDGEPATTFAYWLGVADDGSVIAHTTSNSQFPPNGRMRLWRGTWSDAAGIEFASPCAAFVPPEPPVVGAVMGMHLICVPILSPAPCPPLCPADPVQPAGVLVLPAASVIAGDGWIDPLGVLELADASEFVPVLTVPLGYPAGCGGTFANNYCAVAGV